MPWQRQNRAGFVYFIQEAELKRVKIGFTTGHPLRRLRKLANATSQELTFLGFQVGNEDLEKKLHDKFAYCHYRNEWFCPAQELLSYIDDLPYGSEFERALREYTFAPGELGPRTARTKR